MKVERGLYTDCSETDQPQGTYRFAKNIVDSNTVNAKENEEGFTAFTAEAPYTVIGHIPVSETEIVVFSTDNTDSEVGLLNLNTDTYTTIYNDPELAFATTSPIKGEFRIEVNNERVVAWFDNINPPRILNIDNLSGVDDIQDLNVFQSVENPSITSYAINDFGGALKTGAVIPITKYKNVDGSETSWFVHDKTFYINDDAKSEAFNLNDGAEPGTVSNKSVTFVLSGCDTRYDTIVIGYLHVVDNITRAYEAFDRNHSGTVTVTITGVEGTTDLSLDEVLISNTTYSTVGAMTQLGGQLYMANLTAENLPELQKYALGINIDYTHSLMDVTSNVNSHKDAIPPSFMPGDVYAFYLGVELKLGGWVFYHIPGRDMDEDERDIVVDANLGFTYTRFQVGATSNNGSFSSNMGGWENTNELYPDSDMYDGTSLGYPDLRNQPVRHHRFPVLSKAIGDHYSGNATVGVTHLIRLGIEVSNVNIPVEIQDKITRWKIFYAKKNINNALVIGDDLYLPGAPTDADAQVRWSTGGNWRLEGETAGGGSDGWDDFAKPVYDNLRGHSLDFLYDPASAAPTYAWFYYKLKRQNINTDYNGFRSIGGRLTVCGEDNGQVASAIIDYTVPTSTTRSSSAFIKRLDNFAFLSANALSGKFKTQFTESCFVADIYNPSTSFTSRLTPILLLTNSLNQGIDDQQFRREVDAAEDVNVGEETLYMQYFRFLTDVHVTFTQQDLLPTEDYAAPAETSLSTHGGDTFMCYMSFMTGAPKHANLGVAEASSYTEGVRIWRGYIGYSRRNFNYRYQTQGELSTYYHGRTDIRSLFVPYVTGLGNDYTCLISMEQSQNIIKYDPSLNAANEFMVGVISNPGLVQATSFPDTIIWSIVQGEESKEFSWRSFPAGNRYTISKNKGEIINLQGMKNKELLVHTRHSLLRTRTDANVQAEGENIFFRSANLFDLPPEDLAPTTTGYAGTRNKFACLLTKMGYVYVDDLQGKVFVYTGEKLEEISVQGMRVFFRDYMSINSDNPYTSNGYTVGFDESTNRLLLTKKHEDGSWTMSFNPSKQMWISYHDYTPDMLINTLGGGLYSVKDGLFYKHRGGAKGVFYDEDPYSSYLDITFVSPQDKHFNSVNWITELYPNTGLQLSSNLSYGSTITHLTARTADHCTGRVVLVPFVDLDSSDTANIRNLNRTWYYNDIRDIVVDQGFIKGFYDNYDIDTTKLNTNMEWYDRRRFLDKYLTCRFEYDNVVNNRFLLLDVGTIFSDVKR